jgi:hypothetical protein
MGSLGVLRVEEIVERRETVGIPHTLHRRCALLDRLDNLNGIRRKRWN